jgi:hypothetical protein
MLDQVIHELLFCGILNIAHHLLSFVFGFAATLTGLQRLWPTPNKHCGGNNGTPCV